MAKTAVRPKIIVQAAYTGGADMRELFISLLVNEVRAQICGNYLFPCL